MHDTEKGELPVQSRTHPITILLNLGRVFWLIIIPVLRGFVLALRGNLAAWAQGAWIDILIFLLMIGLAVLRWSRMTYRYSGEEISLESGVFFRKMVRVTWDKTTTVSLVEPFFLRPVKAVRLRVDTLGGTHQRIDLNFLVSRSAVARILEARRIAAPGQEGMTRRYVPHTQSIWALALLTSNSFGGIIFIATFISQSGKLLGNEFSDRIIGTFEEVARLLAFGIPPAAAAIAYVLLIGWLIGFLFTFVRYKNFQVSYREEQLNITSGIFTSRKYSVKYDAINYIDIRQNMVTKLLGMYSLFLSAVGYGKEKDDIAYIIPAENRENFATGMELLFPAYREEPRQVKPHWRGIVRFVGEPLMTGVCILAAMGLIIYLVPGWSTFALFVGLMSLIPVGVFVAVRVLEFATGGFSVRDGYYTMRYSIGITLHKVVIPEERVVGICLQQSLFQRAGPYCDLLIYTKSEGRSRHKCRNLHKEQLEQLLQKHFKAV